MTIDEIMARLTPQEQQHTSPENVAAVLRVLAASIADTASLSDAQIDWIVQSGRAFSYDEIRAKIGKEPGK